MINRSQSREYTTSEVQRVHADSVRAKLEVAFTFLGIAANSQDRSQAQKHIYTAIDALKSADRFFLQAQFNNPENRDINECREKLREQLSQIAPENEPSREPVNEI